MTEHTPGHWVFLDNGQEDTVWDSNHEHMLAWINPKATQHPNEWKANARLISASPDMFAELLRLRDVVDEVDVGIIDRIIAKAKGE